MAADIVGNLAEGGRILPRLLVQNALPSGNWEKDGSMPHTRGLDANQIVAANNVINVMPISQVANQIFRLRKTAEQRTFSLPFWN